MHQYRQSIDRRGFLCHRESRLEQQQEVHAEMYPTCRFLITFKRDFYDR